MEHRCSGEDYNTKFDHHCYLETYYSATSFFLKEGHSVRRLCELFSKMDFPGDGKVLDFGCGPTLHTAAVASRVCQNITLAEYAKQNRDAVQKWLNKEEDAFDWSPFMSYIADFEQVSSEVVEDRTRNAIKNVIPCDVNNESILSGSDKGPFDFIMSTLCLESACTDMATYQNAIANLCSLIKPGGTLYLNGMFGETFYKVNDVKFFSLPVTQEDINEAITCAGMAIESFDYTYIEGILEYTEHKGFYFLIASKK